MEIASSGMPTIRMPCRTMPPIRGRSPQHAGKEPRRDSCLRTDRTVRTILEFCGLQAAEAGGNEFPNAGEAEEEIAMWIHPPTADQKAHPARCRGCDAEIIWCLT